MIILEKDLIHILMFVRLEREQDLQMAALIGRKHFEMRLRKSILMKERMSELSIFCLTRVEAMEHH